MGGANRAAVTTTAGVEATRGTAVTPTWKLYGVTTMQQEIDLRDREEQTGNFAARYGADAMYQGLRSGSWQHEQTASFEDLTWLAQMLIDGSPVTTPVGAGFERVFTPNPTADERKTLTLVQKDGVTFYRSTYCYPTSFEISGALGQAWMLRCEGFSKGVEEIAPTGPVGDHTRDTVRVGGTKIYLNNEGDESTTTPLTGTVIDFRVRMAIESEARAYIDGTDQMSDHGLGYRTTEAELTMAVNASSLSERAKWLAKTARTLIISAEGKEFAAGEERTAKLYLPGVWEAKQMGENGSARIFSFRMRGFLSSANGYDLKLTTTTDLAAI